MKLQYLSDLHLEFTDNRAWLAKNPIQPIGDILLVAGDTDYLGDDFGGLAFWDYCADNFQHTYIIPGNHEYYGGFDIGRQPISFREILRPNVTLLNNAVEEVAGTRLVFSTMWSRIEERVAEVRRGLNDFRRIRYNGHALTVDDFNRLHDESWDFLSREIAKPGPKVVVTHHLPADGCNAPVFRGSAINEAFCIDKTAVIEASDITAWIYGHSHRNVATFDLAGTLMTTNQLGYVTYGEQADFDRSRALEIR
jgi:hypothetical protein